MMDLLKFITCGSVDDGKSTLIGHTLYNAKTLFTDQKKALELESKIGSADGKIDYSLLLDGLIAEREQGITIDVAYRYFTTQKRSFIVADTPGHEEYTRNMAVGASFAELAVILVNAELGVLPQTCRHLRICSLMGIKHFVFAVNKMDLIDYDESRFLSIKRDIEDLMNSDEYKSLLIIPLSATEGDNLNEPSPKMEWYKGKPFLEYLETIDVTEEGTAKGFTLPVQRVCRPNHSFRGFQGQIESGIIAVGDRVTVLPKGEEANIKIILSTDKEVDTAGKGEAVTVCFDREIDVSRGSVIVKDSDVTVGTLFTAEILYTDDNELVQGRSFFIKLGTVTAVATVMNIKYKIDVNDGSHKVASNLVKNELAVCDIALDRKIAFAPFKENKGLGGFILIDRVTNMTAGCGTVLHGLRRDENVVWQKLDIDREFRSQQLGQKPLTLWFTGLSGAGKSTLANGLEKQLCGMGKHTMLLDGDNLRHGLNRNLGFSDQDRIENIRRVAEVAKLMNDSGLIVLASLISPFAMERANARSIIGDSFIEIYVATPLKECEKRDIKGLYQKARNEEIPNFTGISSPYEVPKNPEITINTENRDLDECIQELLDKLQPYL